MSSPPSREHALPRNGSLRSASFCILAILGVSASLAVRYALSLTAGPDLPIFVFPSLAVIVIAMLAGRWPAIAATAAGIVESTYLLRSTQAHNAALSEADIAGLLLFAALGILMGFAAASFRRRGERTAGAQRAALSESEQRFSTVFHSSPISMSILRMSDGQCYDVNQAHVELFGYSREEAVGHTGQELNMWVDTRDRERVLEILSREHRVQSYEARLRRKLGDIITALLSAEIITLEGEKYVWMLHHDITDRRRVEEQLRRVVESAPMALIITDRQGRIGLVNGEAERQFGYPRSELIGSSIEALVPERFRSMHLDHRAEYFSDPRPRSMGKGRELMGRRKNGEEFPVEVGLTPVAMADETYVMASVVDITERTRIENALRESEEGFRLIFERIQEAFTVYRVIADDSGALLDLEYLMVNPAAERQLGMSRPDLVGQLRSAVQGPLDSQSAALFKGVLLGNKPVTFERHDPHSGRWYQVTLYQARSGQIAELSRDITDIKESEIALRTLVDAIPGMVLLTDSEGTVFAANEAIARRLGTDASHLIGVQIYDRLPPEVAGLRSKYAEECIRTGEPVHYEDGRAGRHFDNYLHPIKDGRGEVTRLAILSVDITERKESENKLREQAALLDIASDAILAKDLDAHILYWNKGAEKLYGWSAEEVRGKRTFDLLYSEEHLQAGQSALKETVEKGEWRGELRQRTKDGRVVIVEAHWSLIRDDKGMPSGILSVKSDITAKRSIEAQLLRSQRLESLGTLAGGIAHDLNNVLAPILMGVDGLTLRDSDESARTILSIVKSSAERGANIVRQILNFARGMEGASGEIQPKHVLREIEDIVRETFPKTITLQAAVPRDLWPIIGDATQIHQLLMNLCVNARDAMPGGGLLSIVARNEQLDDAYARMNIEARPIRYVVVTVEDTGTGMPADVLEKIFDPFFTTKEPGRGTGLGLSTVRTIVKGHGGFITVYSEPNRGSSFKVHLPAVEQEGPHTVEGPKDEIPAGAGELILVVDDELSLRDITRNILESYGYRVVTATDGTEAVERYLERREKIHVVITDMMMPSMDGAATIRAIRNIAPGARFIAMSGLMESDSASEARELGVEAFLSKPFTAQELLRTVSEVITGA